MRYLDNRLAAEVPNVVVDGSPNAGTLLTLTHWPGIAQPEGMAADLSAEMAFRWVRNGRSVDAEVVTNNHFDQDGLVAMLPFVDPEAALAHEDLLVDLAAAGDFATYRDRRAARASMVLAAFGDPARSPIADRLAGDYEDQVAVLYEHLLPRLVELVTDPSAHRDLWADEDEALDATERAIGDGRITIDEHDDVDLAVVTIAATEPARSGHRFGIGAHDGAHPMAVHNATSCFRTLDVHGRRYRYRDRYETWVQYRSRLALPRRDLRPLASALGELDDVAWSATAPSSLTPELSHDGESSLDAEVVIAELRRHLSTAPPAWDPFDWSSSRN